MSLLCIYCLQSDYRSKKCIYCRKVLSLFFSLIPLRTSVFAEFTKCLLCFVVCSFLKLRCLLFFSLHHLIAFDKYFTLYMFVTSLIVFTSRNFRYNCSLFFIKLQAIFFSLFNFGAPIYLTPLEQLFVYFFSSSYSKYDV